MSGIENKVHIVVIPKANIDPQHFLHVCSAGRMNYEIPEHINYRTIFCIICHKPTHIILHD